MIQEITGSSPLARGLLIAQTADQVRGGIIPARAGFTPMSTTPTPTRADHPRSRGVYAATLRTRAWRTGSSPLARGLRRSHRCAVRRPRIIPARAGFTPKNSENGENVTDHPRSRGVYEGICAVCERDLGSSPLARGLPEAGVTGNGNVRIIPARAGFTAG